MCCPLTLRTTAKVFCLPTQKASPGTAPQQTIAPHPLRQHPMKRIARRLMNVVGLNLRYQLTPGISIFGVNFFINSRKGPPAGGTAYALE
jgi:hypothetical protein